MKIAVAIDKNQTISQHFGRAPFYQIFTVEKGKITETIMRERHTGHNAEGTHEHHEHDHTNGHGMSPEHDAKHNLMAAEIADCQVMIVGGMGYGAYKNFFSNGINVVLTDKLEIDETVKLFIENKLPNLVNERTH